MSLEKIWGRSSLVTWLTIKKVQESIRRYLRSLNVVDLEIARKELVSLWGLAQQVEESGHRLVVRGWYSNQNKGKINAKLLESVNPGYKVKVSRRIRRDLLAHRKTYGLFVGFSITATSHKFAFDSGERFRLSTAQASESAEFLVGSNDRVKQYMVRYLSEPPTGAKKSTGFVDDFMIEQKAPLHRGVERLILSSPNELLTFAQTNHGKFICKKAAYVLDKHIDYENADKFNFLGGESRGDYKVFTEVNVRRHFNPKRDPSSKPKIIMERKTDGVVEASKSQGRVPIPGAGWLNLKNVDLLGGSLIINEDTLECYEYAADPSWDFVSGLWNLQFGSPRSKKRALVKKLSRAEVTLPESILIGGRNDSNYYHFLIEYLPRVLDIPSSVNESAPILISELVPKSGKEALRRMTNRRIIEVDPNKSHRVKRLHVSAPVAQVLDTTKIPWSEGVFVDLIRLRNFREHCLRSFGITAEGSRKIFVRRRSAHRNLLNGIELEKIAYDMGFELVDIDGMSWEKQVRLFASAKLVVGPGGAIMANYIFLPQGSKVVSLTSSYLADFSLPAYMASVAGASFTYLTGKSIISRVSERRGQQMMHSGYRIQASSFKRLLRGIN